MLGPCIIRSSLDIEVLCEGMKVSELNYSDIGQIKVKRAQKVVKQMQSMVLGEHLRVE
jgi:hypothetical protein